MLFVVDKEFAFLEDENDFVGDEVALLATVGGQVDPHFVRNYGWATNEAKIKKVTVVVGIDTTDWIHTVAAVRSALFGRRLHDKAVFYVRTEGVGYTSVAGKVSDVLAEELAAAPAVKPAAQKPKDVKGDA